MTPYLKYNVTHTIVINSYSKKEERQKSCETQEIILKSFVWGETADKWPTTEQNTPKYLSGFKKQ